MRRHRERSIELIYWHLMVQIWRKRRREAVKLNCFPIRNICSVIYLALLGLLRWLSGCVVPVYPIFCSHFYSPSMMVSIGEDILCIYGIEISRLMTQHLTIHLLLFIWIGPTKNIGGDRQHIGSFWKGGVVHIGMHTLGLYCQLTFIETNSHSQHIIFVTWCVWACTSNFQ